MDKPPVSPPAEPLTLRRVAIDTYRENVAYLHRDCAVYRAEGFQALSKVEITGNSTRIFAVLNVVDDAAIVTAIIAMAHSLDMKVVAEGVEDAAQLAFLSERKCDYLQGYYFSKPCSAEDMRDKLQAVEACDSCS